MPNVSCNPGSGIPDNLQVTFSTAYLFCPPILLSVTVASQGQGQWTSQGETGADPGSIPDTALSCVTDPQSGQSTFQIDVKEGCLQGSYSLTVVGSNPFFAHGSFQTSAQACCGHMGIIGVDITLSGELRSPIGTPIPSASPCPVVALVFCPPCEANAPGGCTGGKCASGSSPAAGSSPSIPGHPPFNTKGPVRYATGELVIGAADLLLSGYGVPWGHTRSFSSSLNVSQTVGN